MRRFAAVVAIGLGALLAVALCSGPPAEVEQQAELEQQAAGKDRPTGNLPLPSRERAGVRGEEGSKSKSAPAASPDPDDREDDAEDDAPLIDPLSANAACYVCHMTFVYEEFSQVHLKEKITCIDCHGVSGPHANDENIGATPPDVKFERHQVDASCAECHEEHDVSPRKIITRWIERGLPDCSPICTDCHGTHKIEQPMEEDDEEEAEDAKQEGTNADADSPLDTRANLHGSATAPEVSARR